MSRRVQISILTLLLATLACAIPGLPDSNAVSTAAAETVVADLTKNAQPFFTFTPAPTDTLTLTPTLIRPTQRPVTETFTPIPTNTGATATEAPTFTLTVTPGPIDVEISVSRPTNCRTGPGKAYEIAGTLLVGETAKVIARDPNGEYWYIPNPDPGVEFCWVWGEYATLTGNALLVPAFTPPPTATSTVTALPSLEFKLKGNGLESCSGAWWMKIEVSNASNYAFSSLKIEMRDKDKNVYRVTSSNGFASRIACGPYKTSEQIAPGASFVVDGANFDYNIHGHPLETFVTMCTEKELKGVCTTRKINLFP